jgi:hypothetical protein
MAVDPGAIFDQHNENAITLVNNTINDLNAAYAALANIDYSYSPPIIMLGWSPPSAPALSTPNPNQPVLGTVPDTPQLNDEMTEIPNYGLGAFSIAPPNFTSRVTIPSGPGGAPDVPGPSGYINGPLGVTMPTKPLLLPLPSSTLPYPTITVPTAPDLNMPVFDGQRPGSLEHLTIDEVLAEMDRVYYDYRDVFLGFVKDNSAAWLRSVLADRDIVGQVEGVLRTYLDPVNGGGTGYPVKIEEAIAGRAHDRTQAEFQRAEAQVWDGVAKRGLYLPSGALMAGLQQARYAAADANAKTYTDIATKNFELEQSNMQFMLKLAESLEGKLLDVGVEYAKVTLTVNDQAVQLMKLVASTMVDVYKAIVQAWLAEWEGYKAAVEVYKAQISALEMEIRLYEAEIKAELAKTEINKATVEVLNAVVNANKGLVEMYKAEVEAAVAPLEVTKVQAQVYESVVKGYAARIEGYVAQWRGVSAAAEAKGAEARAYSAEMEGYTGRVNAFKAQVDAYVAHVNGAAASNRAIADANRAKLDQFNAELEAVIKKYTAELQGVSEQWKYAAEAARVQVAYWSARATSDQAAYSVNVQTQMEMAKQNYGVWLNQIEKMQKQAAAVRDIASVSGSLAASALTGLTSFAGQLVQQSTT